MILGCCNEINIDVSKSHPNTSPYNGVWAVHSTFNGRPVYKRNSKFMFYTEIDGPKRWVVEGTIGKTHSWGYLRNEGDVNCPEDAGTNWSHAWNHHVDSSITVHCGR